MKIFIILPLFACVPLGQYPLEKSTQNCVNDLLDKASNVRYVDGKFVEITDFCEKVFRVEDNKRVILKGN